MSSGDLIKPLLKGIRIAESTGRAADAHSINVSLCKIRLVTFAPQNSLRRLSKNNEEEYVSPERSGILSTYLEVESYDQASRPLCNCNCNSMHLWSAALIHQQPAELKAWS